MLTEIPNADLIAAAALVLVALVAARLAYRQRRPKFLYGENQSVAQIQQRRMKVFEVNEDFDNRHFSPT